VAEITSSYKITNSFRLNW